MLRLKHIIFTLFLLLFFQTAFTQTIPQNEKLIKGTLENGLTYYIYPNDYPKNEAYKRLHSSDSHLDKCNRLVHFREFLLLVFHFVV